MNEAVEPDYSAWLGRKHTIGERIAPERATALAATLGEERDLHAGGPLPPGWHWIFFNPFVGRSELGPDGHPRRGGFLPAVALPRRMWAGGRLVYERPLTLGGEGVRESEISKIEAKSGRGGRLVFVTVTHRISCDGKLCIVEEQDIVYREATKTPAPTAPTARADAEWSEAFAPDPVLLFRYSALTSNAHRIHYDAAYAREEEHYPDLVVHGPLTATLLQGFAERHAGAPLRRFQFRGVSPLFVCSPFALAGAQASGGLDVWASAPGGALAMQAFAEV